MLGLTVDGLKSYLSYTTVGNNYRARLGFKLWRNLALVLHEAEVLYLHIMNQNTACPSHSLTSEADLRYLAVFLGRLRIRGC